ncbi:MAG: indole-3-glycerol phosphate synthase TrpC [Candidatus Omnitrophica bacterium]|nr:indole-3-glycerol phosphate synthase TrpC [Candidatus Omnitrophota bacterium]
MRAILEDIIRKKKRELRERKRVCSRAEIARKAARRRRPVRDFCAALSRAESGIHIIGELKRASPLKGPLAAGMDLPATARLYEAAGVSALSVLTDKHFMGRLEDLETVRAVTALPLLRKDFILDVYQIYEAYLAGADAVLLICAILPPQRLHALIRSAYRLGMAALVEVHAADEIARLDFSLVRLVGINNRDLRTFQVDCAATARLAPLIPPGAIIVSESGIRSRRDVEAAARAGADAVLVGEGIVTAADIRGKIFALRGLADDQN